MHLFPKRTKNSMIIRVLDIAYIYSYFPVENINI